MDYKLTNLLEDYESRRRINGYSHNTIDRVKTTMSRIMRDTNIKNLNQLTTDLVLGWGEDRQNDYNQPLSDSGLYAVYNSVKSFLRFLEETGIPHDVDRSQIYQKPKYRRKQPLRAVDVRKIVALEENPQTKLLIKLLFNTGVRLSEALSLRDNDFSQTGLIFIENGKGGKQRLSPINELIAKEALCLHGTDGYIFRGKYGEMLNRKVAYHRIKSAFNRAGYADRSPHDLRHGYATELLSRGANMAQVSKAMGHARIETTQIYTHLVTDDMALMHRKFMPSV